METKSPYFDDGKLATLQEMLCLQVDELLAELGAKLYRSGKLYYGNCPIHGGDSNSFNLYPEGDTVPGYWVCRTKHCENTFKKTIIGFVRGILSRQKYDWATAKDKIVSWQEAVDWCCNFVGTPIDKIKSDNRELTNRRISSRISSLTKKNEQRKSGILRADVRKSLQIPSSYFVGRGFSKEVLDKYDVGFYPYVNQPLSNRVAVPIYDDEGAFAVGFTGRSIFDRCPKCNLWHDKKCSCPSSVDDRKLSCKWYNHNFSRDNYLYNYWYAKKPIQDTNVAILVEGPGEVWRLSEAGISVGLGMMGCDLTDGQSIILEASGAMNIIVLTNMDQAGRDAADKLKNQLKRQYNIHLPLLNKNDLGECSIDYIKSVVTPLYDKVRTK